MPIVEEGVLKGFFFPEYDGNSVLNLLASITRACGGRSPHVDLDFLPASALAGFEKIILLAVDGLGAKQLGRHLDAGQGARFFARHRFVPVTTVFPATSAAALTTLSTGVSPAEHGILGWHLNLPELGVVSTILYAQTRTGMPIMADDLSLREFLSIPSHLDSTTRARHLLSLRQIVGSRYSRATTQWHVRSGYNTLRGLKRQVAAFARRPGAAFAYVYWPAYDGFCHDRGTRHQETAAHFGEVDGTLGALVAALLGMPVCLIVVSDHGLVDVEPRGSIDLRKVPGFYDCLATLPAGDKRSVFCFVRAARAQAFRDVVESRLADACVCVSGEKLLALGAFGPGAVHPATRRRAGDYVLVAKRGYAFDSTAWGHTSNEHIGKHGGMSEDEVVVPLWALDLSAARPRCLLGENG